MSIFIARASDACAACQYPGKCAALGSCQAEEKKLAEDCTRFEIAVARAERKKVAPFKVGNLEW